MTISSLSFVFLIIALVFALVAAIPNVRSGVFLSLSLAAYYISILVGKFPLH